MKKLTKLANMLLPIVALLIFVVSGLSSCSDEKYGMYSYSFGFADNSVNASAEEQQSILDAYRSALKFTGYETSLAGTEDECNNKILAGCAEAEKQAEALTLNGGYIIRVVNLATYKEIYTHGFGSLKDKENPDQAE